MWHCVHIAILWAWLPRLETEKLGLVGHMEEVVAKIGSYSVMV